MADRLLRHFKQRIASLVLVPSKGGCFELTVNGKLLYSKLATGTFPNEADMLRAVEKASQG